MVITLFSLVILFFYAILITFCTGGWSRLLEYTAKNVEHPVSVPVAVVVACKNERKQLPTLFESLNKQSYRNFHLFLVDDYSNDGSWEYAVEMQSRMPEMHLLRNSGRGKKEALKTAIMEAEAPLIVTLDADCIPSNQWLETIVRFYVETSADLIICPVCMSSNGSFLQNLQQFDFSGMIGIGAGSVAVGIPILCNGANLAFKRQAWMDALTELHFEEPSGDDVFLLQSIKRHGGKIRFLKSSSAMVETLPKESLKAFFNQRRRWAGKKSAYGDSALTVTAVLVFLSNLAVLVNFALSLFYAGWLFACIFFFLKWLTDCSLFIRIKDFFRLESVVRISLLSSFIYPFYIVLTAISASVKRKEW